MMSNNLLPCPFCGGPVKLEKAHVQRHEQLGERQFYGVVCRNTTNLGGTCCMEQVPSASEEAAVSRWNMRNATPSAQSAVPEGWKPVPVEPTDEMLAAGELESDNEEGTYETVFRAMLSAAPTPPATSDSEAVKELVEAATTAVHLYRTTCGSLAEAMDRLDAALAKHGEGK